MKKTILILVLMLLIGGTAAESGSNLSINVVSKPVIPLLTPAEKELAKEIVKKELAEILKDKDFDITIGVAHQGSEKLGALVWIQFKDFYYMTVKYGNWEYTGWVAGLTVDVDLKNKTIRGITLAPSRYTIGKKIPKEREENYEYILALASIIGMLALLGFKIKETVKRNLIRFASLIAGGRKEYLALLAIGVSLTYLIDYTWLQLAIKVSDKGFSSSPLGLILALLWGFLFIWLTYHVIAFFHFHLNLNFLGFIPISLVTIITAAVIYPFSKKLKWLKFFVPILISTVLVYMIPASLLKEYLNRSDLDLIFVYLVGIVWAVRAALVTHFVEFIFKKLGSRK